MEHIKKLKSVADNIKARMDAAKTETETPPWVKQVAMLTGVLAALSGFLTVRSTTLTNDAIYMSDQAILAQVEASDAWNEYEAESIKSHIVDTALMMAQNLSATDRDALVAEQKKWHDKQDALKKTAEDKAAKRKDHARDGHLRLGQRDILSYADVAAQVGIALASVAALVRLRPAFYAGIIAGLVGVLLTIYAYAMQYGMG